MVERGESGEESGSFESDTGRVKQSQPGEREAQGAKGVTLRLQQSMKSAGCQVELLVHEHEELLPVVEVDVASEGPQIVEEGASRA